MSLTNPNNAVTVRRLSEFYQEILPELNGEPATIYGFRVLRDESVPSAKIQYIADNVAFTPAHMDFTNGVFDYGSWADAFFMPKPCMLKYDGTVDYYLDPNDYTKKEDGTASDISSSSYGGNAMMEWPKIWLKIVPDASKDGKQADIFISDKKVDNNYHDWAYHNATGDSVEHFYSSIYTGYRISSVLRSLSGTSQSITTGSYASTYYSNSKGNNPSGSSIWSIETIAEIDLITILLWLIGRSTNVQATFGYGLCSSGNGDTINNYNNGRHNTKGLFYGTNSSTSTTYNNAVKVFGMENWWGLCCRFYLGEIIVDGVRKRKMTWNTEDGSTVTDYNFSGSGYVDCGVTAMSGSNSYPSECIFTDKGIFPVTMSGSGSTYYPDMVAYSNSGTKIAFCSGVVDSGSVAPGCLYRHYDKASDFWAWWCGARISAHPPTPES